MTRGILDDASFLSVTPPAKDVTDYSGQLSSNDLAKLEALCHSLSFKTKVVVLPSDYSPGTGSSADFLSFCHALAHQWNVSGSRFLMVVDLKGHHVRGVSGPQLQQNSGITSDYISVLLKDQFVPYMKRGDITEAIQSSLSAIDAKVHRTVENTGDNVATSRPAIRTHRANDSGSVTEIPISTLATVVVLLVVAVIVIKGVLSSRAKKRRAGDAVLIFDQLKTRLSSLYERSDAIGQASEYLDPDVHADLAKNVAAFFNRVGALSGTQTQLDRVQKKGHLTESYDSLLKMKKMVEMLEPEAHTLLSQVSAATGGSAQIEESADMVAQRFEKEAENAVQLDKDKERELVHAQENSELKRRREEERFRRPAWAYEPTYYEPVVYVNSDPFAGLSNMFVMMNQMSLENSLKNQMNEMNYEMHHQNHDTSSSWSSGSGGDGGADWGSSNSSSSGGADWGSDSGGSSDYGSSSDSGGSGGADW